MKKVIYSLGLALLLLIAGKASAELVCYQWSIFPFERFKLNILSHSLLTESDEEAKFRHPQQLVFSVHGKVVGDCGGDTVRPVVGTLISTTPVGQPFEARLGLENFNTTGPTSGAGGQFCKDVEMSCSAGKEPGFPPPVWNCFSQNKFPVEHPPSQLILVKEAEDPRCSLFEDGTDRGAVGAAGEGSGSAGGLK